MDALRWIRNQWDRTLALVTGAVGGLALLLGWLGMARTVFPAEQLPYIVSGGIAGLFLLGIGVTAWLSADMRDEWRKLDRLEAILLLGEAPDEPAAAEQLGAEAPGGLDGVANPDSMRTAHA